MSTEHEPNDVEVVDKNNSTDSAVDDSTLSSKNEETVDTIASEVDAEQAKADSPEDATVEAVADEDTPDASATNEGSESADVQALHDELVAVQDSIQEYKDQVLRAQAEQQNIRRRLERDVSNAHKYAVEKLAKDLLPIIDSLEHATQAMNKDEEINKAVSEGVELSLKMFTDTLTKHSIVAVDPEGEPFDPQFHEAMSMIVNEDVEPNTVIAVMQKGYTLNQRLIRPARVMVAKAKD